MSRDGTTATTETGAPGPAGRWRDRLVAFGWLVLLWNLLWGEFTWGNLLAGALVAGAVLLFFPLPPVTFGGRLRPRALLVFLLRFAGELITASVHVSRIAVRPGYLPRSAILAVRLRVRTDLNLALTAEVVSLVPGTLIIDVDREAGVLYVHVLDVHGPSDLTAGRDRILAVERRIVRAIGTAAEVRLVEAAAVEKGTPP
ncbi:Na+/H+ antiporter subunit E [Micromonospora endolithica]|uniref:Na+/H+ antiporter subunit E n=1 Tax=Micromonospora endolithica TaxID=230091 RepID=UPI0011ADF307|nr:Na+/H+ antiporter subunit E [Micromonospora endolithica]TWJ23388.1 multisubunit sodium/proton antiporter, MrpE subunit (TC 2.A.63.1) [Micromonospora endolithica]